MAAFAATRTEVPTGRVEDVERVPESAEMPRAAVGLPARVFRRDGAAEVTEAPASQPAAAEHLVVQAPAASSGSQAQVREVLEAARRVPVTA